MLNSETRRILVIDDSEVELNRVKRALVVVGYDVIITTQVVGNARHLPTCHLIIVDYHMPGLNGSEVVTSMRSIATSMKRPCPIVLYTYDSLVALRYKELGFDGAFAHKGDESALVPDRWDRSFGWRTCRLREQTSSSAQGLPTNVVTLCPVSDAVKCPVVRGAVAPETRLPAALVTHALT